MQLPQGHSPNRKLRSFYPAGEELTLNLGADSVLLISQHDSAGLSTRAVIFVHLYFIGAVKSQCFRQRTWELLSSLCDVQVLQDGRLESRQTFVDALTNKHKSCRARLELVAMQRNAEQSNYYATPRATIMLRSQRFSK